VFDVQRPGTDYELRWPRALFDLELTNLLAAAATDRAEWADEVELLFSEAFVSDTPFYAFRDPRDDVAARDDLDPFGLPDNPNGTLRARRRFLGLIKDALDRLPEQSSFRPYYAARIGGTIAGDLFELSRLLLSGGSFRPLAVVPPGGWCSDRRRGLARGTAGAASVLT
jgi:hypothetical protein